LIAYFDTSALVPLLVDEPGTDVATVLWNEADRIAAVRLVYAEGCAAFAMAVRAGRIGHSDLRKSIEGLDHLYQQMDIVEVSDALVRRAGALAEVHSLRGYDAVHLAAAETLIAEDLVFVAGDEPLCQAAGSVGLAVART
jgi:predicted nucleic acid-binding protein